LAVLFAGRVIIGLGGLGVGLSEEFGGVQVIRWALEQPFPQLGARPAGW
jgi:hypothetical protein